MTRSIKDAEIVVRRVGLQYGDGGWKEAMQLATAGFSFDQIYHYFKGPEFVAPWDRPTSTPNK